MKRVKLVALVKDHVEKKTWTEFIGYLDGETESYEEKAIPKEPSVTDEYGFDMLWESLLEFGNGCWHALRGFGRMSMWAFHMVFEGLKYLWGKGVGAKAAKVAAKKK